MPTDLRSFAEYPLFTPLIETLLGPWLGTEIGSGAASDLAWREALSRSVT
ncbi:MULTISPECIES: hypothetical protein [unclassified Streptomyces]|nr:hypothetical protein [Streptomyces sp. TSRI0281]